MPRSRRSRAGRTPRAAPVTRRRKRARRAVARARTTSATPSPLSVDEILGVTTTTTRFIEEARKAWGGLTPVKRRGKSTVVHGCFLATLRHQPQIGHAGPPAAGPAASRRARLLLFLSLIMAYPNEEHGPALFSSDGRCIRVRASEAEVTASRGGVEGHAIAATLAYRRHPGRRHERGDQSSAPRNPALPRFAGTLTNPIDQWRAGRLPYIRLLDRSTAPANRQLCPQRFPGRRRDEF